MKQKGILDRTITFRADDIWQAWLDELAGQAGRTPSAFMRDVIFCLKFTDKGGQVIRTLQERDLNYSWFARFAKLTRVNKA